MIASSLMLAFSGSAASQRLPFQDNPKGASEKSYRPLYCRGVVYEALARYDDAVIDYKAVLKAAPNDPSGWNNLVSL